MLKIQEKKLLEKVTERKTVEDIGLANQMAASGNFEHIQVDFSNNFLIREQIPVAKSTKIKAQSARK